MKKILFLLISFTYFNLQGQVNFTSSSLPIVVINTNSISVIPNEPKITADMGIIYNGLGERNFLTDNHNEYNGKIGIELRGSSSQSFPKKGYSLETRDEAGENNNVEVLGMPAENDWVLHNPFSDKSLIRNALTYKIANSFMAWAPRTRFVELLINGEYLGVYVLMEKIKRDKGRVDIAKLTPEDEDITGGYILKHDKFTGSNNDAFTSNYPPQVGASQKTAFLYHYPKPNEITVEQKEYITDFIRNFEDLLKSENYNDPINGYEKYIDVQSFIDFMLLNELTRNVDGYRLSTYMYKEKGEDGKLHMGPVWDFNLAFSNADYCDGWSKTGWAFDFNDICPNDNWIIHFWWDRLMEDETFQNAVIDRWQALRSDVISDERINFCIDSLANELTEAQVRNFQKWPILGQYVWPNNFIGSTHQSEIDYLKNWTIDRMEWIDAFIFNILSINNIPIERTLKVFPNPSLEDFTFEYTANLNNYVEVYIYNIQGRFLEKIVHSATITGTNKVTWFSDLPAGMYVYKFIINQDILQQGKLVKH